MCIHFFLAGPVYVFIVSTALHSSIPVAELRPRLYWSQNRHNTANQHLSGHTSPDTCNDYEVKGNIGQNTTSLKSDVWLTVHRNSVWIRKTNWM